MTGAAVGLLLALAASPADPAVAEVNGEVVTASRFRARLAMLRAQGNQASPEQALDQLVEDVMLSAEARRRGLHQEPAIAEALEAERRRLASEHMVSHELGSIQPTDDQLRDLYHAGADLFRVRVAAFASREEAEAALERIKKGGDFAAEAARSVDARYRENGGDQGLKPRMELGVALAGAVPQAPVKQPQGPVALEAGFAIFEVTERQVAGEAGFAGAREALRDYAGKQMQQSGRQHLLQMYRRKAGVKLDEAFLRKTGSRLDATPEEAAHVVAKVGGRALRYGELLEDARSLARGVASSHNSGPRIKAELAWARVDRMLLEGEAIARGLGNAPTIQPALWQYQMGLYAQMLDARVRAVPAPAEADVVAYHKRNAAAFAHPARRDCAHILYESRGEAVQAQKKIARGTLFEEVARAESLDKASGQRGGALGEIGEDRLDAMAQAPGQAALATALKSAPPGQVSEPVQSPYGFHLVRCGPRIAPVERPLADVRQVVEQRLREERGAEAAAALRARLRSGARIQVDRQAMARALPAAG